MSGKFEIFQGRDNQYYFRLRAPYNDEIIASSEGYSTKQNAKNGIESVKSHAPNATVVDLT